MACNNDVVESICEKVPCRKSQIVTLLSLMGESDDWVVPSLFFYGHTGCGKSLVIDAIMKHCKLPHVLVNCVECFSSRLLFEHILNAVAGHSPSAENDYTNYAKCDNMNDFVRSFNETRGDNCDTFYIVLDKAERLRDMDVNLLPGLLRLQELSGRNVCIILLTEIVWEKFRTGTGVVEPMVIHFQDYSKDELMEILSMDCPAKYPTDFYKMYLNLLMSVFFLVCKNLPELRHLAMLNFEKYVEPIKKGESTIEDTRKLWRNIEPHLKKALQTVYLREISSAQWEKMQKENAESSNQHGLSSRVNIELPFYSKYMLIAAYLASYNPAKTDKRFFTKNAGKINKRIQLAQQKKQDRTANQLLGPKPFPLDRLMAIFYSIVDARVTPTANIFTQISSLVSLGLLGQVASNDQIECPKYKCLVNLDFVKGIARTVNFEVIRYLYDFI